MKTIGVYFFCVSFLFACGGGSNNDAPVANMDQEPAEPVIDNEPPVNDRSPILSEPVLLTSDFTNVAVASGIEFSSAYINKPLNMDVRSIVRTGVASGDYDNDGDTDFFIVRGDVGPNLLYRNLGNMTFEEVAQEAGVAFTRSADQNYRHSGPIFVDMDGDGYVDLFVGGIEGDPSFIFRNDGEGHFIDVTEGSGIDRLNAMNTISAAFGDYDLDGDMDMFLTHWGTPRDYSNPGDTEHLWRNDSDEQGIRFTSVSLQAGISPSILTIDDPLAAQQRRDWTFTPSFARINDDLYPDIVIASDFNYSQVFINQGNGRFSNATNTNVMIDGNGMGSALGDYDNDGDLDWFVSSILATGDSSSETASPLSRIGNRLYRNSHGEFEDFSSFTHIQDGGWGWGACFLDVNNDTRLDIYQTNGWPLLSEFGGFPTDTTRVFIQGERAIFEDRAHDLGLADTLQGRGVACGDFDNDGDTDILQMHESASLWRNNLNLEEAHWLGITLLGRSPNTAASGARAYLTTSNGADTTTQMREVIIGSHFMSQSPNELLFGLGDSEIIDELRIEWPDGELTIMHDIVVDQKIQVRQPL